MLHADERRVIQQENEEAAVGVAFGRKDAGAVFSLNLEGIRGREVSTGHFFQIPSPQRQRLGGSALRQMSERHTPVSNPPLLNC